MTTLAELRELPAFIYLQRIKGFEPPGDEPWMDPPGAARFKLELAKATVYVEFGSGATTVLADRAGIPAISVESDRYYARVVAKRLTGSVEQIVVPLGLTGPWGSPLRSTLLKGMTYAQAPYDRGLIPDFILVDGRYRAACALIAANQAAVWGRHVTLMFDDYADRPWYHFIEEYLDPPERVGRAAIFKLSGRQVEPDVIEVACRDKR